MRTHRPSPTPGRSRDAGTSLSPVSRALVHRCACGGRPGPSGECSACRRRRGPGGSGAPSTGPGAARTRGGPSVKVELQPHRARPEELARMAPIYARGQTPVVDDSGRVRGVDLAPATARDTGGQLDDIRRRFGAKGLGSTLRGLAATRGRAFVRSALDSAGHATRETRLANVSGDDEHLFGRAGDAEATGGDRVSDTAARLLGNAGPGRALPGGLRESLETSAGEPLGDVRVHDGPAAHRAADALGARAMAVGRNVYFAEGEYRPDTREGRELLAHEVAHTLQQAGASMPSFGSLRVGRPGDRHETQAERFAESFAAGSPAGPAPAPALGTARVQRAISFARTNDTFTTNTMGVGESAAGFRIRPDALPLFQWSANVTINGNAGDPCHHWDVGPHQVVRSYWHRVYWGSGGNRATRRCSLSSLPIRDATAAGNTWYHDPFSVSYSACGDVAITGLRDSPRSRVHPWASPVAGKGGPTGSFVYGVGFVSYISARDATVAGATFRDLASLYWNTSISGTFDTSRPVGSRVSATGGAVNRGGVIEGGSGEFPAMHGGPIANNSHSCKDS